MIPLKLVDDPTPESPPFWRSLDELAQSPAYLAMVAREFPEQAGLLEDPVSRRRFLTYMGASLALAGMSGCTRSAPNEKIVPYVHQPEAITPGKPLYYATAMPMPGGAIGLLAESHQGRPTKVEGNPEHPASLGATDAFQQASALGLYDPDRANALTHRGRIVGFNDALAALQKEMAKFGGNGGRGIAVLTGAVNSPTLAGQMREFLRERPNARWFMHEPAASAAAGDAARVAFGDNVSLVYRVADADVILAIDSDFLTSGPNHLRHAREFMRRRRDGLSSGAMNRLYAVEPTPSLTGMTADHRRPLRQSQIEALTRAVLAKLEGGSADVPDELREFVDAAVSDLRRAGRRSLVIAGPHQPPAVHVLTHAINHRLGGFGQTIFAIPAVDAAPDTRAGLPELAQAIRAGEVDLLLVLSCNPVYSAPADLNFADAYNKVPLRVCLSLYADETALASHWHIPEAHYLESWSDARGPDGTASIIQPLIAPLYDGKSAHEVMAAFVNQLNRPGREIVRQHWQQWHGERRRGEDFEAFWRKSLHDGVIPNSAPAPRAPSLAAGWANAVRDEPSTERGYDLLLRPDPTVFDGRFANNAWLQELPKPLTKIVWENAAIVSPATARELGVTTHEGPRGGSHGELITQLVEVAHGDRQLTLPLYVLPGQADGTITVHLGYGRAAGGQVASGVGANAYQLQLSASPSLVRGASLRATGRAYTLACTQYHFLMENRDLVRSATLTEFIRDPSLTPKNGHHAHAGHNPAVEGLDEHPRDELYTNWQTTGQQWGMVIDLASCLGCGGCVAACQAENNVPVVGKDQVNRGREMHWLRIDRFFTGDAANPRAVHQPVMCMHCENAPCEIVCPVGATTHSADGLNEMTYNRCVGTRYCSNNCPYKVRRFNFLEYTNYAAKSLALQRNPDVSVRVRGVMEKCTYCVQRIRNAEIDAGNHDRHLRDGDVVTACQAACPTEAIVFGNINDPDSRVAKLKKLPRNYGLLTELNTKPRTTYLPQIRNPGTGNREPAVGKRLLDGVPLTEDFPAPDSRLPAPDSRLPAPDSRLPAPDSRLPAPDSRLPAPDSRLPAPDSRLPAPDTNL